jgi:hypothetical protein
MAQKSVSFSSSEDEYYALSQAAKENKFVVQILLSMGIPVPIPAINLVVNENPSIDPNDSTSR